MWHANDDRGRLLIHITSWNELVAIEWAFNNGLINDWSNNSSIHRILIVHGSWLMPQGSWPRAGGWGQPRNSRAGCWRLVAATNTGVGRVRWPIGGGGAAAGDGKWRSGMIGTLGKRRAGERRWGRPNLVECSGPMRAKYFTTFWHLQNRGK